MRAIELAKAHFSAKEVRKLAVPEWGLDVYCRPMTLGGRAKIGARADGNATDYLVYTIIQCALDEQGEPLFTLEDKLALRDQCDPDVVSRVANFILKPSAETESDREKN